MEMILVIVGLFFLNLTMASNTVANIAVLKLAMKLIDILEGKPELGKKGKKGFFAPLRDMIAEQLESSERTKKKKAEKEEAEEEEATK